MCKRVGMCMWVQDPIEVKGVGSPLLELELQWTVSYSSPEQEKYTALTGEPSPSPVNYTMLLIVTETTGETFTYDKHDHQMKNLLDSYGNAMF